MDRRMGKKLLASLLAVVLAVSMMPSAAAFAETATSPDQSQPESSEVSSGGVGSADGEDFSAEGADESASEAASDADQAADATEPLSDEDLATAAVSVLSTLENTAEDEETETFKVNDYATFLADFKVLEGYANTYAREHAGEDAVELVINFIRTGVKRYLDGNWKMLAGEEKTAFVTYVAEQDTANGTSASDLRSLGNFQIPNGDTVDLGHMFGCMNITYYIGKTNPTAALANADLSGWGGDVCDLMDYAKQHGVTSGTVDEMADYIRTNYLGENDPSPNVHEFSWTDVYGDLDAYYVMANVSEGKSISTIMENYFTASLTSKIRADFFVKNRFKGSSSQSDLRTAVLNAYSSNDVIGHLEASRNLASEMNLRTACCYAFADYLHELTGDITDRPSNSYYSVFSSTSSTLAPGVTQVTRQATTKDNKQIVYYMVTADTTRSDVSVYANYKDNVGTAWGMQRVSDQMAAAKERHSNPDDSNYIANYTPVAGVNADFYNMTTGAPSGALVMEGTEYHGVGSENFFGVLKDGTPIIGGSAEWNENKDQIQEAVGASVLLVKDGKSVVGDSGDYYNSRASRTCVGITADNRIVLMVLDGRQEPVSAGGSAQEIAQIMLEAGCVRAVNLDGGGSTTLVTKAEGTDSLAVANRPSDGYERSVSSSLMVVSTARPSDEFDHAIVSADYDYLTVGAALNISASGVSVSGGAASLPEDAVLRVSDESVGSVADGVFTAAATGDVDVQLVSGGTVLGSKTLHVVVPDGISFSKDTIDAVYGVSVTLPVVVTYNGNAVAATTSDVLCGFVVNGQAQLTSDAGTINGFEFTGNESSGIRSVMVGAALMKNGQPDISSAATMTIYLYKADEAIFDFDDATGGDRTLAWKREVSNATPEDGNKDLYRIDDPAKEAVTLYTFAVDMKQIPIPEKIKPMVALLPGGDNANATAWDFLLQLAERVSVLTEVKVEMQIDPNFDVDYSELKVVNEYFKLSKTEFDENGNTLTLYCNWLDQTQALDPATANSNCIMSGIKLTPKSGAAWSDGRLPVENTGKVSYDIYLRSNAVYNIASNEENQEKYGIYPYESSEILYNGSPEKGAHFANEFASFEDSYTLDKSIKNGWVLETDGNRYFYVNNVPKTGIQKLPDYDGGETELYYDMGDNGACKGPLSGLFEMSGDLYFAKNGVLQSGWQAVPQADGTVNNYFFNTWSYKALDGQQKIGGYNYTFTNHVLTRGDLINRSDGNYWYMWAGSWTSQQWKTIDGKQYYFQSSYNAAKGIYGFNIAGKNVYYLFSDEGVWLEDLSGLYDIDDKTYWVENGIVNTYAGLVKYKGFYYYFKYDNIGTAVKNGIYWVDKTNDLLPVGSYKFDAQGKMIDAPVAVKWLNYDGSLLKVTAVKSGETPQYTGSNPTKPEDSRYTYEFSGWSPDVTSATDDVEYAAQFKKIGKNGLCVEDDGTYWIKDGVNVEFPGLVQVKDADGHNLYYYFGEDGKAVKGTDSWVEKTNGLLPQWGYVFDGNGAIAHDGAFQSGIQRDASDGKLYCYVDGIKVHRGMFEIDGDYYYARSSGQLVAGYSYYCERVNGLLPVGTYQFDADGRMVRPDVSKNGIVEEDGSLWYYVGGERSYAGLVQIDGRYYYVKTSGEVVRGKSYWITKTNGLLPEKSYAFADDGHIVFPDTSKSGIYPEDGSLYYYRDGARFYAGLVQIDGSYYYVRGTGEVVHGRSYWTTKTNGLLPEKSYAFADDGKMVL